MATSTTTVRMDEDLKRDFDAVVAGIGLNANAAFNVFARKVVAVGGIPFDMRDPALARRRLTEGVPVYRPRVSEGGNPVLPADWDDEGDEAYDGALAR